MFKTSLLLSLILSFSVVFAADCPFNKPYPRTESCVCKGVKDIDPKDSSMFLCKGSMEEAYPELAKQKKKEPVVCPTDASFDKNLWCVCPVQYKKFALRTVRNICLKAGQKVERCESNKALNNDLSCECALDAEYKNLPDNQFICGNEKLKQESEKSSDAPSATEKKNKSAAPAKKSSPPKSVKNKKKPAQKQ